jgi:hypothetical protein
MTKTKIVKTFELKRNGIVWCTGSVKTCAEFAVTDSCRKNREHSDAVLDAFEAELRKDRKATLDGHTWTVEPITEEYEADEDDE